MQSWAKGGRHLLLGLCLGAALFAAGGCETKQAMEGPVAAEAPASAGLEIREPQVTLTPDAGAVYLTVVNPGSQSDRLLRVETAAAQVAEIHESIEENGVVRMVARPEGFEIAAGETLELQPGGKHIMLMGTQVPADAAGPIPLTLHFERAGAIEVQAALSRMADTDHSGHTMDHGDHATDHGGHGADHSGHEMDHGDHSDHGAHTAKPGGGS